jgi:hypothetical protein
MGDPERTEELRNLQESMRQEEERRAESTDDEHEAAQHERRAEKARYLREKLDERVKSERESGS